MRRRLASGDHPAVVNSLGNVASALEAEGKSDEASRLRREAFEMQRRLAPEGSPQLAAYQATYALQLLTRATPGAAKEAEPILRDCLTLRRDLYAETDPSRWLVYSTMSMLGGALTGQAADPALETQARVARLREAEPLVLEGYQRLRDDPKMPPPGVTGADRVRQALERVAVLHEVWEKTEPGTGHAPQADHWRAELAAYDAAHPDTIARPPGQK